MTLEEVLEESWAFQEMRQKAYEQGYKEVKRQDLLLFIKAYFPNLVRLAQDVCDTIRTLEELQDLFEKVLLTKDEEKVRQLLLRAQK